MNYWPEIAIGLGTWVVTTIIYETVKHFWNPVRWRFTSVGEGYWYLKRVSGPTAYAVTFGHQFTAPPIFADDMTATDMPVDPELAELDDETRAQLEAEGIDLDEADEYVPEQAPTRQRFRDIRRGRQDLLYGRGVDQWFYMFWVELGGRRSVEVRIPAGASVHEVRRRDLMRRKLSTIVAEGMGMDSLHVPD